MFIIINVYVIKHFNLAQNTERKIPPSESGLGKSGFKIKALKNLTQMRLDEKMLT